MHTTQDGDSTLDHSLSGISMLETATGPASADDTVRGILRGRGASTPPEPPEG